LDTALQKAAQAQHIACKGMSVGRYLAFITELFPNQTIKAYGENLSERELERPLEYLVSRSLSSKK
jgi:hypothetical protein